MGNDLSKQYDARSGLVGLATALLHGPLQFDEVLESAPADTYLTGILWPRNTPSGPEDDDDAQGADKEADIDQGIPGYRAIRPCSVGVTLAVRSGVEVEVSLGQTARYIPVDLDEPDNQKSRDGRKAKGQGWARKELAYKALIPADTPQSMGKRLDLLDATGQKVEDESLSIHMRLREKGSLRIFTFTLINEESEDGDAPRDSRCLFQAGLVIRALDQNGPAIQPRPSTPIEEDDEDALCNALLYRGVNEFAVGHGVAVVWDAPERCAVPEIRTAWLPATSVRGTSPEGHVLLDGFRKAHPAGLKAAFLGRQDEREKAILALDAFVDCYTAWIDKVLCSRQGEFQGVLGKAARLNLSRCQSALERMQNGVNVLRNDDYAWLAFSMANQAMDTQSRYPAKGAQARPLSWRPFQLAFMLLVLPGLTDPEQEDRECMDLLWFPTGGGKTEAYLALTAFQIFHRRLTSQLSRTNGGVDVLMRYTLRLLTVQQFQRAAALITACETMRSEDSRLGTARITLGLYVGDDSTPNKMEKARQVLEEERLGQKPPSTPRQLLRCPVCGDDLLATAFKAHASDPRIDIVCENNACNARGQPLPVLTVDEAIYAAPPSLLIGTIDKFAQLPRTTKMRPLFGLDGGNPPGLIIQDELHLISGPLGSMSGLYETAIDLLCTRGKVRPKIIGSTATIGQAAAQVRALFDRSVLQFPPPGFESDDSFFAVRDTKGPDRLYVGVPTAGRSPKFALQAVVAALLQGAHTLLESNAATDEEIDAYWSCVSYFNSLRELGGAYVLMQDDVPRQMEFLASRLAVSKRELERLPVELSSRKSSRELPSTLQSLSASLQKYRQGIVTGDFTEPPEDTVLASNMISVGVDVPRLGLMVVNGQPKSTAEYIQASSRVGRSGPGLVFTLYNFGRPRDLSHFEHFCSYHSALYKSVEATSVTPWAPRARDKALHAVVASVVRHLVPGMTEDDDALNLDASSPVVNDLFSAILTRASAATNGLEETSTHDDLESIMNRWEIQIANAKAGKGTLRYWKKSAPYGKSKPHLMFSAEDGQGRGVFAWPTPGTMREVEPSSAFWLKEIQRNK